MKKDFFEDDIYDEEIKEEYEEYEEENEAEGKGRMSRAHYERARILAAVIPFVLIIFILAGMLIANHIQKKAEHTGSGDLQESIKDYADQNKPDTQGDVSGNLISEEEAKSDHSPSPSESPAPSKNPSPTPSGEIMESGQVNYDHVEFNKDEQLKEMMTYWADNNQKALDDLANLERFIAMSWKLRGTKDFYYYGDTDGKGQPNGTGIAVYADNQYYYGGWLNGQRSGNGTWIHYHIHTKPSKTDLYTYHQYTGGWQNDLPEGEGSEHYDFNLELLKENTGYNANLIGSYHKGLINGEFYLTNLYSDGNAKEWYAEAQNGSWVYQNENVDDAGRRPVQVEDRDPNNYIWLHPDENWNIGVPCLISPYKN